MNKLLYALVVLVLCVGSAAAQSGEIQGKVTNDKSEGIPFANVVVYKNGVLQTGATTDFDGKYSIPALEPGTYEVEASYVGLKQRLTGITVSQGIVFLPDIVLSEQVLQTVVVKYQAPLVDKGNTSTGGVVTKEDIQKIATRNVTSIAATKEGVYQSDEGGGLNIKGSRGDATEYIIDGVRVSGSLKLPQDAIEQLEVITGGVDPKYGDATGGFITITTRGPAKDYNGSIELASSQYLDDYGYNLASLFLTGPFIVKNKGTDSAVAKFGFFLAGELEMEKDPDPSATDVWAVKGDVMQSLIDDPLRPSVTGAGFNKNSEFITKDDLETIGARDNVNNYGLSLNSKLDYKFSKNTNLQLGLSWRKFHANTYSRNFALFNAENNPVDDQNTYRGYLRFTQRFPEKRSVDNKESVVGNAYYSIQLDYTKFQSSRQDADHGMNPFAYGYIGQFNTYKAPVYFYTTDETTGLTGWVLAGYADTLVEFTPGEANPALAEYTTEYINGSALPPSSLFDIQLGGGLLNGDASNLFLSTYNMWWNYGVPWFNYSKSDDDQYSLNFAAALDLKNPKSKKVGKHSIEFGFEFQQRVERFYGVNPIGLWTIARQLTNKHILTLDTDNPILLIDGEQYTYDQYLSNPDLYFGEFDTITYNRLSLANDQAYFDAHLRDKLNSMGYAVGDLDYINIDNLPLDVFDLNLFSADELLNQGSSLVFYNGYDYLGNAQTGTVSFNDFFTQEDDNGVKTRPIDAFRPVYTAGYIQDRFNFNDIVFRVGVRVDRYDANRKVLIDKYSIYDVYSTAEVDGSLNPNGSHPGNIGQDYVVYVDDFNSPSPTILGYRDEDTWFNADGEEVTDPNVIAVTSSTGTITPYVVDPDADIKDANYDPNSSFEDYTPQITIMPRIAFSFPISKVEDREALFFAHYDILTQRPPTGTTTTPADYYFFLENAGALLDNPDLKPEKTIDYQVGFQQQLSTSSVIKISAFYKELRDMIQVIQVPYAYPLSYTTYGNLDFGTVKGLSISYDIARRTRNLKLSTSYTLQFADGTGSSATSQINLVGAGQPNLRTIIPLSYDSRHAIKLVLDYRFENPKGSQPDWLDNAGMNVTFNARSGEPYTRQSNPLPTAQFGINNRSSLEGAINGSRLPWHYRTDIKVDRAFEFGLGKGERPVSMDVYLWVQNLFDAQNVIAVYPYTGNPTDDGYLTSAEGIEAISSQVNPAAFVDLYNIKMDNPDNYSIPRRIRVGVSFDF
ncbi:MAG TPA: carboxypeptidase regulatory-like domain-containing protein [Chitinophagales bacterium]|nr:carboxypeptidase regulatory-like domain-containing protein [Chitinophagales bacterium]HMZ88273.1 carboxypeptidase regulatory-like domain-containing protein [Chitinophagales bacterium]HNF67892.1 carboxypeptidase regulatory-like domain-containing protein [Chitinophagales bacterium]HNJ87876.1 carboxypeptidase regulatory-like domain-containing protein [Chitinophagales bacterium]HNK96498.1 carboxypeptidase regulatory-like domain-containing protein [Chitinophagales bacterium]